MNRNELQMQLDSKESDIEQLREKLNDLQQRMDNSSITSLQTDETDSNIAGRASRVSPCTCTPELGSSLFTDVLGFVLVIFWRIIRINR